ncbi:hypothetical protein PAHAL_9G234400 [Panicum hallii]|uniref:WRC domain-containing protein n=2 Tax=Panicum hallii TaxID=206008 RepID=A0A2T8I291_9POAL|nr:hypothetical protein PAHAL_9G234400 [Panicum hallii]
MPIANKEKKRKRNTHLFSLSPISLYSTSTPAPTPSPSPASTKNPNPSAPGAARSPPLPSMRIRKSAARLLGSAYSAPAAAAPGAPAPPELLATPPPPQPHPAACSPPPESRGWGGYPDHATASGEACELSRSPWDLIAELSLSDPQEEDDLVDRYFVHVTTRASWLFSASMPVSNAKKVAAAARERAKRRRDAARKALKKAAASKEKDKKDAEAWSKAKVKKEEGEQVQAARVWKCKKNDGKRWHCHRTVSQPNTLCNYHFVQKRSYLNPDYEFPGAVEPEEAAPVPAAAASKPPSSNSKPRRKKPTSDFNATEGFYYYAGFGPFRSKRHCRSGGTNEPVPVKQEEEEEQVPEHASPPAADQARTAEDANQAAAPQNDVSTCDDDIAGIAGVDEDTSDDDYDGIGIAGSSVDGGGDAQASNGGGKRKTPWKRWRKPVKARSLKSLM